MIVSWSVLSFLLCRLTIFLQSATVFSGMYLHLSLTILINEAAIICKRICLYIRDNSICFLISLMTESNFIKYMFNVKIPL